MDARFFTRKKTTFSSEQIPLELLGHILSFLDYINLNNAMWVNKTWHQLIKNNHTLLISSANSFVNDQLNQCFLIRLDTIPQNKTFYDFPIKCHASYVRYQNQFFYVNNINKICVDIIPSNPSDFFSEFDKIFSSTTQGRILSKTEIAMIDLLTGHNIHNNAMMNANYEKIKQQIINRPERAPHIANQLYFLMSEKNRSFKEKTKIKNDMIKSIAKGLGYSVFTFVGVPIAMLSLSSAVKSHAMQADFFNVFFDISRELFCSDNLKYKAYSCDPYFMIPFFLVLAFCLIGLCYKVGRDVTIDRYKLNPFNPYRDLISDTNEITKLEINDKNATGETIPIYFRRQ